MKKIALLLGIAFLAFGFTKPAEQKSSAKFDDWTADYYFFNHTTTVPLKVWATSASYQVGIFGIAPGGGTTGYWTYDDAAGISINVYPGSVSAPHTYAHIYGMYGLVTTLDISTGGVVYNYLLPHSQVMGTGWGVIVDHNP